MKKIIYLLLAIAAFQPLFGVSVGKDGEPYLYQDISWQPVKCDDEDRGFTVDLPGKPVNGLNNGFIFTYSIYNDVVYEVHFNITDYYVPPKKAKEFLKQVKSAFPDHDVVSVPCKQKKVKYCCDIIFAEGDKIIRLFCSSNTIYWALVEGDDLTLAPLFFDTVKVTK